MAIHRVVISTLKKKRFSFTHIGKTSLIEENIGKSTKKIHQYVLNQNMGKTISIFSFIWVKL